MESIPLCCDMLILPYILPSHITNFQQYHQEMPDFLVLKDHHQALKYTVSNMSQYECRCFEIYKISQVLTNFYKIVIALKCTYFIFHTYIGGHYIVFLLFLKLCWLVLTSIFLNIQLPKICQATEFSSKSEPVTVYKYVY